MDSNHTTQAHTRASAVVAAAALASIALAAWIQIQPFGEYFTDQSEGVLDGISLVMGLLSMMNVVYAVRRLRFVTEVAILCALICAAVVFVALFTGFFENSYVAWRPASDRLIVMGFFFVLAVAYTIAAIFHEGRNYVVVPTGKSAEPVDRQRSRVRMGVDRDPDLLAEHPVAP